MRQVAQTIDQIEAQLEEGEKVNKKVLTKELVIERDDYGLYSIAYTGGGEIPDKLKGRYTSYARAQAGIDNYKVQCGKERS